MILIVDIGNTDIVFAINKENKWVTHWREKSKQDTLPGTLAMRLKNQLLELGISAGEINKIIISSVVPALTPVLLEMCHLVLNHIEEPILLGPHLYNRLRIKTNNPEEIGTDLIANAVAAYHYFEDYCVVVDFGTALTFTTINNEGHILGVSIAPGLKTAMKSLSKNTAQLPEIHLELPDSILGKHTTHAMQAGILYGYIGLVNKILDTIESETGEACKVIATGGLSSVLKPLHARFDKLDKNLTLEGLKIISEML